MTDQQVLAAAQAANMSAHRYRVSNMPGETAIELRDATAAPLPTTSSNMVAAMANGGVDPKLRSGLKMVAWISAATHGVMEIEVRNAGVDPTESATGGQLLAIATNKFGEPTRRPTQVAPGSPIDKPAAALWGSIDGPHLEYRRYDQGDTEMIFDLTDANLDRYELDVIDPAARKANAEISHPASTAPRL